MRFASEMGALLRKELLLEWKQKYALNGLLLYSLSMAFVIALALFQKKPEPETWNVIFWLMMMFVAVNAVAKSFMSESPGQNLYVYTLASPQALIAAKLVYNCVLLAVIGGITFAGFLFFSPGVKPGNTGLYLLTLVTGAFAFASNLTLVSAIASRGRNQATLLAVLGFPLLIPQLLACIVAGSKALTGAPLSMAWQELAFSACFFVVTSLVSFVLFPYLWRD